MPDDRALIPHVVAGSEWLLPDGYQPGGVSRCSGPLCGALILWSYTPAGKRSPFDADGTPHWATCPDRARFTKKGG